MLRTFKMQDRTDYAVMVNGQIRRLTPKPYRNKAERKKFQRSGPGRQQSMADARAIALGKMILVPPRMERLIDYAERTQKQSA